MTHHHSDLHNAPSVYFDSTSNTWVYRASALGGCLRSLVYGRMGMEGQPPPEWLQERFDEGHYHEAPILARFEEDQGYSLFTEWEQPLRFNSFTIDGWFPTHVDHNSADNSKLSIIQLTSS